MTDGVANPDILRFFWLAFGALFLGGVSAIVRTYTYNPPRLTARARRKFVLAALAGGTLLVVGFGVNVLSRQDQPLAPGTPIGMVGLVVILTTMYVLLWCGRQRPRKGPDK